MKAYEINPTIFEVKKMADLKFTHISTGRFMQILEIA